jgi:hypothetical protein
MRKAAGIILIISGGLGLVGLALILSASNIYVELLRYVPRILWDIGSGAFLIIGGVFCLRRRYWRACLISAAYAIAFIGIPRAIDYVTYAGIGIGALGQISVTWGLWVVLVGGVTSTIFISLSKKEWREIPDSVNREVSQGG